MCRWCSSPSTRPREPAFHHGLGQRLAPLRDEGVLIVGSGNLVHNLHAYAWGRERVKPYDWALRFEDMVRSLLQQGENEPLISYGTLGPDALLAVPTPDHYLPFPVRGGAAQGGGSDHLPGRGRGRGVGVNAGGSGRMTAVPPA
ncbi:MAG: dioxygenase, partial [Methanomicrobiales archaeon]|nr:dioxygenase [Methanomicrobiales archaeon]